MSFRARTKVNAPVWLRPDGGLVTANAKHLAASYATSAEAEAAIQAHVHPAHHDWMVEETGANRDETVSCPEGETT